MNELVDPDDFLAQAKVYFEAMSGEPIDDDMPEPPDDFEEFNLLLTRAEVHALLPLIATAQLRGEIDSDPWVVDQQQWWAITRARLEALLR